MNIANFVTDNLSNAALWAIVPIGTFVLMRFKPPITKWIKEKIAHWKNDLDQMVKSKLSDPLIREWILGIILVTEKTLRGKNGQAKFNHVKKIILDKCPDWADDLVGACLQTVYDEAFKS